MNSASVSRRSFLYGASAWTVASLSASLTPLRAEEPSVGFVQSLREIEKTTGGRLGVAFLDTRSQATLGYRMDERFPMCSTFKLLAVAALLSKVDAGREDLSRHVTLPADRLLPNSPMTKDHTREGMTLAQLCEAAVTMSDNTAANLILKCIGGPPGFTAYARSIGDTATRLDRIEPALNHVAPGDPRDTTTPAAMLATLKTLVLGTALAPASRERLVSWFEGCKTGDARLRAGVPKGWKVGDKTGTSDESTNDIAVFWPPDRPPIVMTAYLTGVKSASDDQRNAAIASVGRAVAETLAK
jgi:beta-lactamase class A